MIADPAPGGQAAPPPVLERSNGVARIVFCTRDDITVLGDLFQSGSAKIRLPRRYRGQIFEAITINTSGGMTDGDSMCVQARWQAGTTAAIASQAAERIYKSRSADATITTRLEVEKDATALWLPQETILFDGARIRRKCCVNLAPSARLLAVESLVYGRSAMGETVNQGAVHDRFDITIDGRRVWTDAFCIRGNADCGISTRLDRPAIGAGARATATVIARGPDPEPLLTLARGHAADYDIHLAATTRETLVIVRLLAKSGTLLRPALVAILGSLKAALIGDCREISDPAALPRVWAL